MTSWAMRNTEPRHQRPTQPAARDLGETRTSRTRSSRSFRPCRSPHWPMPSAAPCSTAPVFSPPAPNCPSSPRGAPRVSSNSRSSGATIAFFEPGSPSEHFECGYATNCCMGRSSTCSKKPMSCSRRGGITITPSVSTAASDTAAYRPQSQSCPHTGRPAPVTLHRAASWVENPSMREHASMPSSGDPGKGHAIRSA